MVEFPSLPKYSKDKTDYAGNKWSDFNMYISKGIKEKKKPEVKRH